MLIQRCKLTASIVAATKHNEALEISVHTKN